MSNNLLIELEKIESDLAKKEARKLEIESKVYDFLTYYIEDVFIKNIKDVIKQFKLSEIDAYLASGRPFSVVGARKIITVESSTKLSIIDFNVIDDDRCEQTKKRIAKKVANEELINDDLIYLVYDDHGFYLKPKNIAVDAIGELCVGDINDLELERYSLIESITDFNTIIKSSAHSATLKIKQELSKKDYLLEDDLADDNDAWG